MIVIAGVIVTQATTRVSGSRRSQNSGGEVSKHEWTLGKVGYITVPRPHTPLRDSSKTSATNAVLLLEMPSDNRTRLCLRFEHIT